MNVWLLLIEKRITSTIERAIGPFTSIIIQDDRITDGLTGREIVHRIGTQGEWGEGDGRTGRFDRLVIQAERPNERGIAPWGDRGL